MSLIRVAPPRAEWGRSALSETLGAAVGEVLGVRMRLGVLASRRSEHAGEIVYEDDVPDVAAFAEVPEGEPLLYINILGDLALALNRDDFAATYGIESGPAWTIEMAR